MLNANAFSRSGHPHGYAFGCDAKSAAEALRDIAAKLESGELVLASASVRGQVRHDDFSRTLVVLKLHEKKAGG